MSWWRTPLSPPTQLRLGACVVSRAAVASRVMGLPWPANLWVEILSSSDPRHIFRKLSRINQALWKKNNNNTHHQEDIQTSLVVKFLAPKFSATQRKIFPKTAAGDCLLGQQWTFHFPNLYCYLALGHGDSGTANIRIQRNLLYKGVLKMLDSEVIISFMTLILWFGYAHGLETPYDSEICFSSKFKIN